MHPDPLHEFVSQIDHLRGDDAAEFGFQLGRRDGRKLPNCRHTVVARQSLKAERQVSGLFR